MIQASGTAGIGTTDDTAVTLIANANSEMARQVTVINTGAVAGFISLDGGTTWFYLPASATRTWRFPDAPRPAVVKAKRIAAGTNLTGLYADML